MGYNTYLTYLLCIFVYMPAERIRNAIKEVIEPAYCFALYRPAELFPRKDVGNGVPDDVAPNDVEDGLIPEERQKQRVREKQAAIYKAILQECNMMAGLDVVEIDDEYELVIGTSFAASPHTVLWAPTDEYSAVFREVGRKYGLTVPEGPLIVSPDSTDEEIKQPESVPLDAITWVMKRNKQNQEVTPVDINDFTTPKTGNTDIDQYKLELTHEKMNEILEIFVKRIYITAETNLQVYNEHTRKQFPFLPEKKLKDILQGYLVGYFRGDGVKGFDQFYYSGEGMAPMSNPTLHGRAANHLELSIINVLNLLNRDVSMEDILSRLKGEGSQKEVPENGIKPVEMVTESLYFRNDIDFVDLKNAPLEEKTLGEVLKETLFGEKPITNVEELLKIVDPYGTIAHDELNEWLQSIVSYTFSNVSGVEIGTFRDHTKETERELRGSEGITIKLPTSSLPINEKFKVLANGLTCLSEVNGIALAPMWDDIKSYVTRKYKMSSTEKEQELKRIRDTHYLPGSVMQLIDRIMPTEKQLKLVLEGNLEEEQRHLIERKLAAYARYKKIVKYNISAYEEKIKSGKGTTDDLIGYVKAFQEGQIFDDSEMNKGFNIPGVPGLAVTFHFDEKGDTHINMGWLLSVKGLFESWMGAMVKRSEKKGK